MSEHIKAIIVDDDSVSNSLVKLSLSKIGGLTDIISFISASRALEKIRDFDINLFNDYPTIILLDINLPIMNGWMFLNEFDKLNECIKSHYKIYMLSSSIDWRDIELAKENKNVSGYFVKPLLHDKILSLLKDVELA